MSAFPLILALAAQLAAAAPLQTREPSARGPLPAGSLVYLVMVDRFRDGTPNTSDVVAGGVRRFQGGDLRGVLAALPYFSSLGVTHLWLTPLHQQVDHDVNGTAPYHGYWPAQLDAIDQHFGSIDDYQALVAAAEHVHIGIILDVVTNHLGYGADDADHLVRDPCGDSDTTRCLFGLPDLQTEDPRVRTVVAERTAWWAKQARRKLAGIRLDAFKHIDRATAVAVADAVGSESAGLTVVAEEWGATAGDANVDDIVASGAADAVFDFGFMGPARDFLQGRMRSAAFAHHLRVRERARLTTTTQTLPFLDNHDTETWTFAVSAERSPIGAALLFSDGRVPVLTWGTELRRRGGAADPENRSFMPWAEAETQQRTMGSPLRFWQQVSSLRHEHRALGEGELRVTAFDNDDTPHFIVFQRSQGPVRAIVAVSLDRPLRHVEALRGRLVDVAGWHGAAHVEGDNLVIDVEKNGAVVVIVAGVP